MGKVVVFTDLSLDGVMQALRLVSVRSTPNGVVIVTYHPAEA